MASLECPEEEKDLLAWRDDVEFLGSLGSAGNSDDTLLFTAKVFFWKEGLAEFTEAGLALTDQGIYFMCLSEFEVHHHIGSDCVLDLFSYESVNVMRIETDEGDVLFRSDVFEHIEMFTEAFSESILPLPVESVESIAPYAAEKRLASGLCSFLGVADDEVEEHVVEDAVELLERKRQERLEAERQRAAEAEDESRRLKEEMRKQMEHDRNAAQAEHEKGKRRLSIRRRKCDQVGRALKRWLMAPEGAQPAWWEGEWVEEADEFDPLTLEETRVELMSQRLQEEADRLQAGKLRKIMAVLAQVEREEANLRKVVEGESRLMMADLRDLYERDRALLRKSEHEWRSMTASLISRLEKDEAPARMKLEMEEEHDRRRVQRARSLNMSRLDDVLKLLKSTTVDEYRIREEVVKLEARHWADLAKRWESMSRRAQRRGTLASVVVNEPESRAAPVQPPSPTDPVFSLERVDFKRVLMERTKSVRRRHLTVSKSNQRRPVSPLTPTSPMSDRSASALAFADDLDMTGRLGSDADSQSTPYSSMTPRGSPPSAFPSPVSARRFDFESHSATVSGASSPIRSGPQARRPSVAESPTARGSVRDSSGSPVALSQQFPQQRHPAPVSNRDFASRHLAVLEDMQNELRRTLGLSAGQDGPANRAAVAAALAAAAAACTHVQQMFDTCATAARSSSFSPPDAGVLGVEQDRNGSMVVEWQSGVVTVKPHWSQSVLYTYKPVAPVGGARSTFSNRHSTRDVRDSVSPARSIRPPGTGIVSPPPAYRAHRRSASPMRNLSPLRGGGALCGSLCVHPPRFCP